METVQEEAFHHKLHKEGIASLVRKTHLGRVLGLHALALSSLGGVQAHESTTSFAALKSNGNRCDNTACCWQQFNWWIVKIPSPTAVKRRRLRNSGQSTACKLDKLFRRGNRLNSPDL
eukprot:2969608-Amphidinium_carterae.1